MAIIFRRFFLTIPLIACLLGVTVHAAGVSGSPAYPRPDNPRSSSIFVHVLNSGDTVTDGILVSNNTSEEKIISIYPADSLKSSGGGFACGQETQEPVHVGSWITLDEGEVVLESGAYTTIDFTIAVPEDETLSGEYNGCIVVQEKYDESEEGSGVSLTFRSAVRVAITINSEHNRRILENPTFSLEQGDFFRDRSENIKSTKVRLRSSVENRGNLSVDTKAFLVIRNMFGVTVFSKEVNFPVLPTTSRDWYFDIPKPFIGGKYTATLVFNYDKAGVGVGEDSGVSEELYAERVVFYSLPQPLAFVLHAGALILFLLFLFIIYRFYKRRSKKRKVRRKRSASKR